MNVLLVLIYVAAMVTANLVVWLFGPWVSPINAFVLIGLDLTMRDVLQERLDRMQLGGVIITGAALTWLLNPAAAQIAIASAVAFLIAALVDWAIYSALASHRWLVRANASNVAGAAVDSVIFPTLAFGVFLPGIIAAQFAAKVAGGALWSLVLKRKAAAS